MFNSYVVRYFSSMSVLKYIFVHEKIFYIFFISRDENLYSSSTDDDNDENYVEVIGNSTQNIENPNDTKQLQHQLQSKEDEEISNDSKLQNKHQNNQTNESTLSTTTKLNLYEKNKKKLHSNNFNKILKKAVNSNSSNNNGPNSSNNSSGGGGGHKNRLIRSMQNLFFTASNRSRSNSTESLNSMKNTSPLMNILESPSRSSNNTPNHTHNSSSTTSIFKNIFSSSGSNNSATTTPTSSVAEKSIKKGSIENLSSSQSNPSTPIVS
jgi:hypothetical protein